MSDRITPADLAVVLGVSQKAIRDHLRARYGKLPPFVTRWLLTSEQATDVRRVFTSK